MTRRCDWASNGFLIKYHDKEWGVPLHNDRKLFEFLILRHKYTTGRNGIVNTSVTKAQGQQNKAQSLHLLSYGS